MTIRRHALVLVLAWTCSGVRSGRAEPPNGASQEPPPITADLGEAPLLGDQGGLIYVRDRRDFVRFYPHAELDLEAHGFFGSGVSSLGAEEAGVDLAPRFFVRRLRFELGGEVLKRFAYDVSVDSNANPAIDGARVDARRTRVALADAWGYVSAGPGISLMAGVFQAPFSMENRTATSDLAMLERNVAIRGFVVPAARVLGAAIDGSTPRQTLRWTVGAFGAESLTPGELERAFDGIGRIGGLPLARRVQSPLQMLEVGVSVRAGSRNPRDASGNAPAITTGQGFALWRPTRLDGGGRTLHVVLDGAQRAVGVEVRLPLRGFSVRSECYLVSRHTRESLDGLQATQAERAGHLRGVGWYAEVSAWPLQIARALEGETPSPGNYPHPEHLELARITPHPDRYGLEVAAMAAGIQATYDAAIRGSPEIGVIGARIEVFQLGLAVNYWHTRRFRLSSNLNGYWVPNGGGPDNQAIVPSDLAPRTEPRSAAQTLWEFGSRATLMF